MTLCAERGLDIAGSGIYAVAMHFAALSDVIVTVLRARMPNLGRPEDRTTKSLTWASNCFVEPSGVRLRRIVIVDRWNEERKLAESHSWRSLGEMAAYELPMSLTVVLVGQRREGKHHSPWSKGWLHPRSHNLRIRKRSGEGFDGRWIPCWREEQDELSRDLWIDTMRSDGVLGDVLFDVDLEQPCPELASKIRHLAANKLQAIREATVTPPPNISVCDWPTPCQFRECCWSFTEPSERNAFVTISH